MEIAFIGPSYHLESRPSGVQRTINMVPVPEEPGNERTAWVFKDVPGLTVFTGDVLPGVVFTEDFERPAPLDVYSTLEGNRDIYHIVNTLYGKTLQGDAQQAASHAIIERVLFEVQTFSALEFKFKLLAINPDDGVILEFFNGGTNNLFWNPLREVSYDALRRPEFIFQSEGAKAYNNSLTINIWYKVLLMIIPGAGNSYIDLINTTNGSVLFHNVLANAHTPISFDRIRFTIDQGLLTSPAQYDDINCYNP